jgi:radical SAM superfamily enzyme YgiQ (UPF0313 family)
MTSAVDGGTLRGRRRGLLLVPEFPYDSFWSYRYVMRLIGRRAAFPPLGLLTFAGYLPDHWDLEVVDLNVRAPSDRALARKIGEAHAVFVSAMSIQKRSLVQVLEGPAKGLDTPFVLGGPLASSYRDQILDPRTTSDRALHRGLDALVWGEAGGTIEALLEWLDPPPVGDGRASAGRTNVVHEDDAPPRLLIPRTVAEATPGDQRHLTDRSVFLPLDEVPLPRWDLIRVKDYHSMMLQTTAGCPFRCDFCDIVQFNGGFSRPRSPEVVRRELEAILATGFRGSVFGVDDNFVGARDAIPGILDAMIEFQREHDYPFTFFTQASVTLGLPGMAPVIDRMKRAGFTAVFLGIETPDERALHAWNKKQNLKVDVPETVARIQAAGIEVYAGFIFGGDEDTPSAADRIVEFAKRTRIFTAMAGMLTPIPHTPLYRRLRDEGRLLLSEFSGNNTDDEVQLVPRRMTTAEMKAGIHRIMAGLFEPPESYRRALEMLRAVQPHSFVRRRLTMRYAKAGLMSVWRQGVRRLDREYFAFLWRARKLDREIRRRTRREARRLRREARRLGARLGEIRDGMGVSFPEQARLEDLVELAHDFRTRFRPELSLEQVRAWVADVEERIRSGAPLAADEVRTIYENARGALKARGRLHRFPGVILVGAIEAAIKGLHYEKVVRSVVGSS